MPRWRNDQKGPCRCSSTSKSNMQQSRNPAAFEITANHVVVVVKHGVTELHGSTWKKPHHGRDGGEGGKLPKQKNEIGYQTQVNVHV